MDLYITSLCYVERDGKYLMLHRVKKEEDRNRDKWIGIGGSFLEDESPEDCVRREAREETGLTLVTPVLRAVITFVVEGGESELMFLFTCEDFTGTVIDCDEGELAWIAKEKLYGLELWEGDRIFLEKIAAPCPFFTLKLVYDRGGHLLYAEEDGTQVIIDRRST
ncbi:MAG: 8-oxo-dGTP diphosphatase [Clostridia bacterium]|nr:8-oxo-dGTP diphosphatase [Clostridia bacterium]